MGKSKDCISFGDDEAGRRSTLGDTMKPFIVQILYKDGPVWEATRYEEFETLKEAEARAKVLREKMDARAYIYAAL